MTIAVLIGLPALPALADGNGAPKVAQGPVAVGVPIPGSSLVRGRAKVTVAAPIEAVRARVLAFGEYADFMPHYSKSRVLGRTKDGKRDVFMEVEALHGAVKMWARMSVAQPRVVDGVEIVDIGFVEGNVRDFSATWSLKAVDAAHTELTLEVFLQPKLPLPASILNDENVTGALKGVAAMRTRVEQVRTAQK
jgi:ribosome-associated toxin RatA of RatAB toxin-antitoxin module